MNKAKNCLLISSLFILFAAQPAFADLIEDFPCALNIFKSEGIKSKIDVGFIPIDVAVNSKTNKVYVLNFGADSVSVIDGNTSSLINTISITPSPNVDPSPYGIAVNEETNTIYVSTNDVIVIDGNTNTVTKNISLPIDDGDIDPFTSTDITGRPSSIATNPNNNKVYVTTSSLNTIYVIDGNTNTLLKEIIVGGLPYGIAVNTKTNKVYVANQSNNFLSVIDSTSDTVIKTIENLGEETYGVTVDEENNIVYAFSLKGEELLGRGFLFKIDGSTDSVIESFIIGSNGTDIAFHPATKKIYVTHTFNGTIDGYNEKKKQLLCAITEVDSPSGIAINPKTNLIYVCNNDLSTVTVLKDGDAKDQAGKPTDKPKDEPLSEGVNQLEEEINGLREIQNSLKQASKFARPVAARLGALIKRLSKVLNATKERCNLFAVRTIDSFESLIPMIESRTCSEAKSRRCIPEDIADEFILDLEEKLEVVNSVIETDDNENGIADVCE